MGKITDSSNSKSSADHGCARTVIPKTEVLDLNVPSETLFYRQIGDHVASSSGSNIRSSFIEMGFSPSLVDRVINEKGEDNVDLLLEALFAYSALQKSNSESPGSVDDLFNHIKGGSNPPAAERHPKADLQRSSSESSSSLDSLFGEQKDESNFPVFVPDVFPKKEPDIYNEVNDDKRASLLMMNFAVDEIEFAMDKLGADASVAEMVDFIIAAQIAEDSKKETDYLYHGHEKKNEDSNNEVLFGTMDKTLRLLEMGFSENEISSAIEKFGSEVPISELADSIFTGQMVDAGVEKYEYSSTSFRLDYSHTRVDYRSLGKGMEDGLKRCSDSLELKTEECSPDDVLYSKDMDLEEVRKGKRPKQESLDNSSTSLGPIWLEDVKPNPKVTSCWTPFQREPHWADRFGMGKLPNPNQCSSLGRMVAKPPYFFYGNVMNVSHNSWAKMSQFLYGIEPEYVNTQFFSALSRKEGYIHNLPAENRFHILPKPPMTIETAIPQVKKWWPSWDTRKQLNCINFETNGISQLCDKFERILIDSRGFPSAEQRKDILHHCWKWNLMWAGQYKLAPTEPEHLECILGYPLSHTQVPGFSLTERFESLKNCFQTDTLGYHLSVLKSMFPEGLTVLSLYSGIGGAEVSLHRAGIRMKAVVSVESSETRRRFLQRWWHNTGQTGELVQIEDVSRLASNKLESLMKKLGGFDFVICQNPCIHSAKGSTMAQDCDGIAGFDFSLFCEFVRILQIVRSTMGRNR